MGLWDDEVVESCGSECMIFKYKVPRSLNSLFNILRCFHRIPRGESLWH